MSYKIVVDSCCELPEELKNDPHFERIPLVLQVGDYMIEDDESFDQKEFLRRVAESEECAKSSCPSPLRFAESFWGDAEHIYVVTLSSKLSGSYNSAVLARTMYLEEHEDTSKRIYICDSESASGGECQYALLASQLEKQGVLSFEQIVERLEQLKKELKTYFILDNLETLRKNGRLSGLKAMVASKLSIKPVMAGDRGSIVERAKAIGTKKALSQLARIIQQEVKDSAGRRLIITHCNCRARAEEMKNLLTAKMKFAEILIMDTGGISTLYANDGGIIVTV